MDLINAVITSAVTTLMGLIVVWLGKGRFDSQDRRVDRLEERIEHRIDGLQASVDGMRSDLTQVGLAVGMRPKATNG
jgi:hypothetical protein